MKRTCFDWCDTYRWNMVCRVHCFLICEIGGLFGGVGEMVRKEVIRCDFEISGGRELVMYKKGWPARIGWYMPCGMWNGVWCSVVLYVKGI